MAPCSPFSQEGNMPLEELLAIYRYEASVNAAASSSMDSSSGELTDELPDMTLDKVSKQTALKSGWKVVFVFAGHVIDMYGC